MSTDEHTDRYRNWSAEITEEIEYWRMLLSNPPPEILERFDPKRRFRDAEAVMHLAHDGLLRVLDVGSGPCSTLGYTFEGCRIDLVAVDALAMEYMDIMRETGRVAPVPPLKVDGEKLTAIFPVDSFDCVYAINALDHCYDPILAISNMLEVARPGGGVTLNHFEYAGRLENYEGLHQWDFFVEDGRLLLANREGGERVDLGEHFRAQAELIDCKREQAPAGEAARCTCSARLRKLPHGD